LLLVSDNDPILPDHVSSFLANLDLDLQDSFPKFKYAKNHLGIQAEPIYFYIRQEWERQIKIKRDKVIIVIYLKNL
jgi:hypothetical protein